MDTGIQRRSCAEPNSRRELHLKHGATSSHRIPSANSNTPAQVTLALGPYNPNPSNMPGRRSRSPTPDRSHRRTKRRDEYDDEDDKRGKEKKTVDSLSEVGVKEISDDDYL